MTNTKEVNFYITYKTWRKRQCQKKVEKVVNKYIGYITIRYVSGYLYW